MANWKEPKNDYKKEDQVVPEIFNTLAENERYLQEKKITTEQVQDAEVNSTQSATRENVGDKETVKGFFGKVRKWFADLKALAFKGTVGTADIDSSAVTSAKIASNAVTSAKIASNAVTTAKINAKAVTDEKINSVSASKVTGLHKVATSGSYNDLTDKPTIPSGGGGLSLAKYEYSLRTNYPLMEGLFLCYVRWHNRGSVYGVSGCGLLSISKWAEAGSYSGVSSVYESDNIKIQIECRISGDTMSFYMYESQDGDGNYAPNASGVFDGGAEIVLYKLGDNAPVGKDSNTEGGLKTWQYLDVDAAYVYGDMSMKSVEVPVDGLKVGDTIRATAMSLKVNMDYTSESYFFNTGNILYGWVFDGSGWYQLQDEYDYGYMGEKELSSESPFVSECGLFDYETPNKLTIKISCKRNGYLTVEWSDQGGCYIEMMPLYNFQVLR